MKHVEALVHWLKTYNGATSIEDAYEAYMQGTRDDFAGSYCSPKENEARLIEDIRYSFRWRQLDNWELVLASTIYDEDQLNQDYDYPVADHAQEENLCQDCIKVFNGKVSSRNELGYDYRYPFVRPFNVRVFNRKDGDYEIAFVFTDPSDNTIIAISQRED